jgi:hypothetical protein
MTKTHIAGFPVKIGHKGRQLCAWCGEILFEVTGQEMGPLKPDGSPPDALCPWEMGALIEVYKGDGVTGYTVLPHEDGADLPANACVGPPKLRSITGGRD